MKERTLFERIVLILGVILSTLVWVIRLLIKLVSGVLQGQAQKTKPTPAKSETEYGQVQLYQSETDPNEPDEGAVDARDASDTPDHPEDDTDDDAYAQVHYRDIPDTIDHPEDDPDHEAHAQVHYRDIPDTIDHPEDDPDHEAHAQVHYRDVPDTIEYPDDDASADMSTTDTVGEFDAQLQAVAEQPTQAEGGKIKSVDGTCPVSHPIKGNANSKIYHVPDAASYEGTKAEFCFSSEDEAKAAGYRAPKR